MNDLDHEAAFTDALASARGLPTRVLRRWERNAARRAAGGAPSRAELAQLLAVRAVLRDRARP